MAVNVAELKATLVMDLSQFTGNANTAITTFNSIKAAADSAKQSIQAFSQQAGGLRTVATALGRVGTAAAAANKNLQAFAANAALFNSLNASLASIATTAGAVTQALQGAVQELKQLTAAANGLNNLNTSLTNVVTTMTNLNRIGHAVSGLGRELMIGLTLPLTYLGKEALDASVRFDSLERALTAITGSSKIAADQMLRLNEIAKLPGIGLEEAIQGSVNLQSAGLSAEMAERSIKAFGNALVYSGRGKEELVGIEQILAKIEGREILSERQFTQLTLKVPKMRALLKEAFGTGDVEKIQKSGLPVDQIIERLVYAAEQIPKVTGGIQNDIDNFHDHITRSLKILGDAIQPIAHEFLTTIGPEIEKFANWFKGLPDWEKKGVLLFAGLAAGIGPFLFALGQVLITVGRIQTALAGLQLAGGISGVMGTLGSTTIGAVVAGAAVPAAVVGAAAGVANYANEQVDKRAGKQDVSFGDAAGRVFKRTPLGFVIDYVTGHGEDRINEEEGYVPKDYAVNAAEAYRKSKQSGAKSVKQEIEEKAAGGGKPPGWGTLSEGPEQKAKRLKDEREVYRLKLDDELETAKNQIDLSEQGHGAEAFNKLSPILLKQAQDLRKEADEMHINQKSTADELKGYYHVMHEANQKELESNRLKAAATKEQDRVAKEGRATYYRVNEMGFRGREAAANANASDIAPEGQKAQTLAAELGPVIQARQAELVQMWNAASLDTANANEAAIRRAQIEEEYWNLQRKGAQISRQAATEVSKNAQQAEKESLSNAKAYRSFQTERIKVLAEEATNEADQAAVLTREVPLLRQDELELLNEAERLKPNTKEYWDNARAFWSIEDEITKLTKNQSKARAAEMKKAQDAQKQQAHEHREMLDLETHLMEARLKNNPFLSDQQRKNAMVPMLIKQYRAMLVPIQGETELETLRRQLDAENMKHDLLEQFGLGGKGQGARVLGGGRLNMSGLSPRALQQALKMMNAPITDKERHAQLDPLTRTKNLAAEAAQGRPVVYQVTWTPGMSPEQMKQAVWKAIDEMATSHDPVINR